MCTADNPYSQLFSTLPRDVHCFLKTLETPGFLLSIPTSDPLEGYEILF